MDSNRFQQGTIETLSKRANLKCSNPYCGAPTSGPHADDTKSVNVGVAAHIRGANPGSARYDPEMTHEERSAIVNGIWLCQTCAKLVDNDVRRFTVDVLYAWKREHEACVLEEIGYEPGERERRQRVSKVYASEPPAARQIALDQPLHWEYLLLAELLRSAFSQIQDECQRLERRLIYRRIEEIRTPYDLLRWTQCRIRELEAIIEMANVAINQEMQISLGDPGEPGDAEAILQAINDIKSACAALLEWDCDFIFSFWPRGFEDLHREFECVTMGIVSKLQLIPEFFNNVLTQGDLTEEHSLKVTIAFPKNLMEFLQRVFGLIEATSGRS